MTDVGFWEATSVILVYFLFVGQKLKSTILLCYFMSKLWHWSLIFTVNFLKFCLYQTCDFETMVISLSLCLQSLYQKHSCALKWNAYGLKLKYWVFSIPTVFVNGLWNIWIWAVQVCSSSWPFDWENVPQIANSLGDN